MTDRLEDHEIRFVSGFHVTDRDADEIGIKRDDISSGDILLSRLKNCTVKILTR